MFVSFLNDLFLNNVILHGYNTELVALDLIKK